MKRPLFDQGERWFIKNEVTQLHGNFLELRLSVARFRQAVCKPIEKLIMPIVKWLDKIIKKVAC